MARPPKIENINHPLKKLRMILGKNRDKGCTQHQLSALTGIPERTIHSIEGGDRNLTASQFHKILLNTGASWNGRRWMQGTSKKSFTAKGCDSYHDQKQTAPAPGEQAMSAEILCAQLRALLEFCSLRRPSRFNDLVFALQDAQEDIRAAFDIKELAAAFDHTQLWLSVQQFPNGKIEVEREHPHYSGWTYLEPGAKGLRLRSEPWKKPPGKRSKLSESERRQFQDRITQTLKSMPRVARMRLAKAMADKPKS
jgi:transcriptional regulator with XRE-family HTH domain